MHLFWLFLSQITAFGAIFIDDPGYLQGLRIHIGSLVLLSHLFKYAWALHLYCSFNKDFPLS